jgi:predicted N-formylglutamate amidohydrolase
MVRLDMASPARLLQPDDGPAATVENADGRAPILLICDHARPAVPRALAALGLGPSELSRHIAYDIGAAEVARHLARWFDAPFVASGFSRLVVDCNRRPEDPGSMPPSSDGTEVPANRTISPAERALRLAECFQPYHDAIEACIAAAPAPPAMVSIHSFTPSLSGFQRPWQIGILWNEDQRIATPLMAALAAKGVAVGDNQPYSARDPHGYTLPAHAESRALPHVLIEIRQDLIHEAAGAESWATLLHDCLVPILHGLGRHPGRRS